MAFSFSVYTLEEVTITNVVLSYSATIFEQNKERKEKGREKV